MKLNENKCCKSLQLDINCVSLLHERDTKGHRKTVLTMCKPTDRQTNSTPLTK